MSSDNSYYYYYYYYYYTIHIYIYILLLLPIYMFDNIDLFWWDDDYTFGIHTCAFVDWWEPILHIDSGFGYWLEVYI